MARLFPARRTTGASPVLSARVLLGIHLREVDPDFTNQWNDDTRQWAARKHRSSDTDFLGVTGGDLIFTDPKGRVWGVDLVCESIRMFVGLMPHQWEHPPTVPAHFEVRR